MTVADPRMQPTSPSVVKRAREQDHDRWTVHDILQRFKLNKKFSGMLEENINEFLNKHKEALMDCKLFSVYVLHYLHNLFYEEAQQF